jgi:hypothetical protein
MQVADEWAEMRLCQEERDQILGLSDVLEADCVKEILLAG